MSGGLEIRIRDVSDEVRRADVVIACQSNVLHPTHSSNFAANIQEAPTHSHTHQNLKVKLLLVFLRNFYFDTIIVSIVGNPLKKLGVNLILALMKSYVCPLESRKRKRETPQTQCHLIISSEHSL